MLTDLFCFLQMVKPVLRLLSRKNKTNSVTPSTCNYDVVESVQNELNEAEPFQLQFKFYEESADNLANEAAEAEENAKNEALEQRLRANAALQAGDTVGLQKIVDGRIVVEPVPSGTYFAIPVHFVETVAGQFTWAPLPDRDISRHGYETPICSSQVPEQQVAVTCVSAA